MTVVTMAVVTVVVVVTMASLGQNTLGMLGTRSTLDRIIIDLGSSILRLLICIVHIGSRLDARSAFAILET